MQLFLFKVLLGYVFTECQKTHMKKAPTRLTPNVTVRALVTTLLFSSFNPPSLVSLSHIHQHVPTDFQDEPGNKSGAVLFYILKNKPPVAVFCHSWAKRILMAPKAEVYGLLWSPRDAHCDRSIEATTPSCLGLFIYLKTGIFKSITWWQ